MDIETKKISNKIIKTKEQNMELVITSIVVGLGINLLATGIINILDLENNGYLLIIAGSILSVLVVVIYMIYKIKSFNSTTEIKGCFIFDKEEKNIIPIPEFKMSKDMSEYLTALLLENKEEKRKFNKSRYIKSKEQIEPTDEDDDFKSLINYLIEYLILNELANNLIDYYNEEDNITEYNFDNLPLEIKNNVFLSTIAKDISNRKPFHRKNIGSSSIYYVDNEGKKTVCSAHTFDGYIYEKFELLLPQKAKIYKKHINQIIINTKYYKIKITWYFNYYGACIDSEFYEYILKMKKDWDNHDEFSFDINVEFIFKPTLVFNKNKQKYYAMLDVILNKLIDYFDYDNHLEKINWSLLKNLLNYHKNDKIKKFL